MKTYNEYKMDKIKSAVYNALAQLSMEQDASQEELEMAIEWFMILFYENKEK